MPITDETSELIRELESERERLGVSKSELAERLGIRLESLRATLNNRGGEPSLSRIRAIAEALGCKITVKVESAD